ncbi:MAG: thioesterase [Paenibacillaceae bacterium]|jgi:acyl-CoA thioester hydrolase|nr:thioesterase [Paenibacillaceae bacterium]
MCRSFKHIVRVRYAETDQMGVVYHSRYLDWFEIGRTEMLRGCGMSYGKLEEEQGLLLPVVDVSVQYRKPARYDDEIVIHTCVKDYGSVRLEFTYEIRRRCDEELLATGTTRHMWVNREWKPARIDRLAPQLHRLLSGLTGRTEES